MTLPVLYWIKAQAPRRVLALIKHLKIDADFREMDLLAGDMQTADYLRMNPNAKAPVLVDGDRVLWESSAIMAYLAVKADSDMWPANEPDDQIEVLQWLSWCDHHWSPAVAPYYFERVVKATFSIGEADENALAGAGAALHKYAKVLNAHLKDRKFVALNRLTIADFQLGSMATYWKEARMPLSDYPEVVRWLEDLMRIPAWADPWPDGQRP